MNNQTNPKSSDPVAWELRVGKTDRALIEITNDAGRAHAWKCSLAEVVPLYTHPAPTLSDDELAQVLDALKQGHDQALMHHARYGVDGKYHNQAFAAIEQINAAIALLEKVKLCGN